MKTQSTLLQKDEGRGRRVSVDYLSFWHLFAILCFSLIVYSTIYAFSNLGIFIMTESDYLSSPGSASSSLAFTLYRKNYNILAHYNSSKSDWKKYQILNNYSAVIEPNVENRLFIYKAIDMTNNFTFTICDSTSTCYFGYTHMNETVGVTIKCQPHDKLNIVVYELGDDGKVVSSGNGSCICLYVRRELREYHAADLKQSLAAMYRLWNTSEVDGQEVYGSQFHNITYFVKLHLFNAGWRDSDHIHEGMGFFAQHIKLTNMFESAMQAVDNSVTLPYWDFTIDTSQKLTIFQSPMFTDQTFGTIKEPFNLSWGWTYDHDNMLDARISDSLWKDAKMETNIWYPELRQGYGFLRAPWNTNPNPYISRYTCDSVDLPTCFDYAIAFKYDSIATFLYNAEFRPHGAAHRAISGWLGCDTLSSLRESGTITSVEEQLSICSYLDIGTKVLFRQNVMSPLSNCSYTSLTRDGLNCGYFCPNFTAVVEVLKDVLGGGLEYLNGGTVINKTEEAMQDWARWFCYGEGHKYTYADHMEAASPADPSFWPIHGTVERALQVILLTKTMKISNWDDSEYICDYSSCYEDGVYGEHSECCDGHRYTDQLRDWVRGNKSQGYGDTNEDIMIAIDATSQNYSMRYIYSHFDWKHCASVDDLLEKLYSSSVTPQASLYDYIKVWGVVIAVGFVSLLALGACAYLRKDAKSRPLNKYFQKFKSYGSISDDIEEEESKIPLLGDAVEYYDL